jgi:predicted ester cyclase
LEDPTVTSRLSLPLEPYRGVVVDVEPRATDPKQLVRRLVDEVMNDRHFDRLDVLCTDRLAPKLRLAFQEFLEAFPDWRQEIVELVHEDGTVVARFRCTGTHEGAWRGLSATGRSMRVDEVYFFRVEGGRISGLWGLEDTWSRMRQLAGEDATLGELGSLT